MLMFGSFNAWRSHELDHRREWFCPMCGIACKDEANASKHLTKHHGDVAGGHQIEMLLRTSSRPPELLSAKDCPFCDWDSILRKRNTVSQTAGLVVPSRRFMKHLGKHLEELALFVIPQPDEEDGDPEEVDSNAVHAAHADDNESVSTLSSFRSVSSLTKTQGPEQEIDSSQKGDNLDFAAIASQQANAIQLQEAGTRIVPASNNSVNSIDVEIDSKSAGTTRCVCGQQTYPGLPRRENDDATNTRVGDAGETFVQCDSCYVWQHSGCVGIFVKLQSPDVYHCELCRPEQHEVHEGGQEKRWSRYTPLRSANRRPSHQRATESQPDSHSESFNCPVDTCKRRTGKGLSRIDGLVKHLATVHGITKTASDIRWEHKSSLAPVNDYNVNRTENAIYESIACICGVEADDGNAVACGTCKRWAHAICYYPQHSDTLPAELQHTCIQCRPDQSVDFAAARLHQSRWQSQQLEGKDYSHPSPTKQLHATASRQTQKQPIGLSRSQITQPGYQQRTFLSCNMPPPPIPTSVLQQSNTTSDATFTNTSKHLLDQARQVLEVLSYSPEAGEQGTEVTIYFRTPYSLDDPSTSIVMMFGSQRCSSVLSKKSYQGYLHGYAVTAKAPSLPPLIDLSPVQIPLSLLFEGSPSWALPEVQIGTFAFYESRQFEPAPFADIERYTTYANKIMGHDQKVAGLSQPLTNTVNLGDSLVQAQQNDDILQGNHACVAEECVGLGNFGTNDLIVHLTVVHGLDTHSATNYAQGLHNGNHALADYQMRLMMLDLKNQDCEPIASLPRETGPYNMSAQQDAERLFDGSSASNPAKEHLLAANTGRPLAPAPSSVSQERFLSEYESPQTLDREFLGTFIQQREETANPDITETSQPMLWDQMHPGLVRKRGPKDGDRFPGIRSIDEGIRRHQSTHSGSSDSHDKRLLRKVDSPLAIPGADEQSQARVRASLIANGFNPDLERSTPASSSETHNNRLRRDVDSPLAIPGADEQSQARVRASLIANGFNPDLERSTPASSSETYNNRLRRDVDSPLAIPGADEQSQARVRASLIANGFNPDLERSTPASSSETHNNRLRRDVDSPLAISGADEQSRAQLRASPFGLYPDSIHPNYPKNDSDDPMGLKSFEDISSEEVERTLEQVHMLPR
jgi:hypothetical protein